VAVKVLEIWNEVDEFLTSTPTPKQILEFRPSQPAQERLHNFLEASSSRTLTAGEEAELNEIMAVEQFMRRLKIKALAKAQACPVSLGHCVVSCVIAHRTDVSTACFPIA
jgi:dsDNA-specific endonuclease/ATPase MutS2